MDFRLCDILDAGMRFLCEYDPGSPTELILKVAGEVQEVARGEPIQIMTRNEAPIYECSVCGAEATEICCECIYEDEGWLCEKCTAGHECGEDMLLPVFENRSSIFLPFLPHFLYTVFDGLRPHTPKQANNLLDSPSRYIRRFPP